MSKIAFLFPGQGAQAVGMGKDLYDNHESARKVLDQFNQWTLSDLQEVTFNGPEETLKRTLYTQPALLSVSLAALTVFQEQANVTPYVAAGHSLGELGALYSAGVLDLETTAKLVKQRAECMENARPGVMAAILGLSEVDVEKAVLHIQSQNLGVVTVANYNTAEQSVISGEPAAVEAACAYCKELGAMKTVMLPVGGAFHSPLMKETNADYSAFLKSISFSNAAFPVITNVDAQLTTEGTQFQQKLDEQMYSSVRWLNTMRRMNEEGVDTYIEFGPGKVLTGMIKRIYKEAKLYNVSDAASLEKTVESLKEKASV